jgi:hypothetical protein
MALDTTIGGATSDSYITLTEWRDYWDARGVDLAGQDAAHEAQLRRAAQIIDATYDFRGVKHTAEQSLEWPRSELTRTISLTVFDPYRIIPTEIPRAVKDAQAELAYLLLQGADPFATFEGSVKREKIDVIEVEYAGGRARPQFTAIDRILRRYVLSGPGQGRMVRA